MAQESDFLHCRFCKYKVLKFKSNKGGPATSGFIRLKDHIGDQHPDEFDKIYPDEAQQMREFEASFNSAHRS